MNRNMKIPLSSVVFLEFDRFDWFGRFDRFDRFGRLLSPTSDSQVVDRHGVVVTVVGLQVLQAHGKVKPAHLLPTTNTILLTATTTTTTIITTLLIAAAATTAK